MKRLYAADVNLLQKKKYSRLEDVAADFDLLFRNAQQYNVDESRLFKVIMNIFCF